VIHISGDRATLGKIVKINQGLTKIFNYGKTDILGQSINILMPSSFARRHNSFLENYYRTGREIVFNVEHLIYGMNRSGHCFPIKIYVRRICNIEGNIEYVGMIKQTKTDYEYIITDQIGIIDTFSSGIERLFNLSVSLFKENNINIQILAPELISSFTPDDKKGVGSKFYSADGHKLLFTVPKGFSNFLQPNYKKNLEYLNKTKDNVDTEIRISKNPLYWIANGHLNNHKSIISKQVTAQQLLQSYEYKECEWHQTVKCKISEETYNTGYRHSEPLRIKVFAILSPKLKHIIKYSGQSDGLTYLTQTEDESSDLSSHKESYDDPRYNEEVKKELINFTTKSPERLQVEHREDTKLTDRISGNIVTTESRIDTTIAPILKVLPENAHKIKEVMSNAKDPKLLPLRPRIFVKKDSLTETESLRLDQLKELNSPKAKNEEESTPCMKLGSLKAPLIRSNEGISSYIFSSISSGHRTPDKNQSSKIKTFIDDKEKNKIASYKARSNKNEFQQDKATFSELVATRKKRVDSKLESCEEDKAIFTIKELPLERKRGESSTTQHRNLVHGSFINTKKRKFSDKLLIDTKLRKEFAEEELNDSKLRFNVKTKNDERKRSSVIRKMHRQNKIITNIMEDVEYTQTEEEIKLRKVFKEYEEKRKEEKQETGEEKNEDESGNEIVKETKKEKKVEVIVEEDTQSKSTTESLTNAKYSFSYLRTALDEKFVPKSLRNLKYIGILVFLLLLVISIVYFVVQTILYNKLNKNIQSINYSEERIATLFNINFFVTKMIVLSADYNNRYEGNLFYDDPAEGLKVFDQMRMQLKNEADVLNSALTHLSLVILEDNNNFLKEINTDTVVLIHKSSTNEIVEYVYNIREALMEIIVAAYRIAEADKESIDDEVNDDTCFLIKNSLNNVILSLDRSAGSIIGDIKDKRNKTNIVFIILLCVASFSLVLSIVLLIPVVNKIKKNKQEVLELFMYIRKSKVAEQLDKCRKFMGILQINQETDYAVEEREDPDELDPNHTGERIKILGKTCNYGSSKRGHKKLNLNLGIVIFKLVFLILLMEGYFILDYLLSSNFLKQVSEVTSELSYLISIMSNNTLLVFSKR